MNAKTKSMIFGAFFVAGLIMSLTGLCKIAFNQPVSENDAIQNAARVTEGPDGETMYTITDGEIQQASNQMQTTNTARVQARQGGKSLVLPGFLILSLSIVGFGMLRSKKQAVHNNQ